MHTKVLTYTAIAAALFTSPVTAATSISPATIYDAAASIQRSPTPVVISYNLSDRSIAYRAIAANPHAVLILDGDSHVARKNARTLASLKADGGFGALTRIASHIKAASTLDGLYMSDRNWAKAGIVLLDRDPGDDNAFRQAIEDGGRATDNPDRSTPNLALRKDTALAREAVIIAHTRTPILFSTESFGDGNPVYPALLAHAAGSRILVADTEYNEIPSERALIAQLVAAHANVRLSHLDEKIVITDTSTYTGSANASPGVDHQLEWAIVSQDPQIRQALANRWNAIWNSSVPLPGAN